ncbi:hypothetical protein B0H17DRAFT_1150350 [Mycena rosella]|uniref:Uncharacterized protein n=1 Tax=Mycena rosella TaxID=1033263 RepID=A0AAD7BTY1_MYCRO|nr:hypothetical protein B0H17DRAFT_1150350 [Mycena rosella]
MNDANILLPRHVPYAEEDPHHFLDDSVREANADEPSNQEDDTEAAVRRADQRDFDMPAILAGHEHRLNSPAPYRIPEHLLVGPHRANLLAHPRIPARPSHPPTPARRSYPALCALDSRKRPAGLRVRVPATTLCIVGTDPAVVSGDAVAGAHPPILAWDARPHAELPGTIVAGCVHEHNDEDEDDAGNTESDEDLTLNASDLEFIDDEEEDPLEPAPPLLLPWEQEDIGQLADIAARFEQQADAYAESALLEDAPAPEVSAAASVLADRTIVGRAVQDAAHSILPRPIPLHAPLPQTATATAAQIAYRVRGLLKSDNPGEECIVARKSRDNFIDDADEPEVDDGCEIVMFRRRLNKKAHPRVYPTIDDVEPFQRSRHPMFTTADFVGHAQALQLCVHAGTVGYILDILDVDVKRSNPLGIKRVTMMKVTPVLPPASADDQIPGDWFQLGELRRHVLSPSPRLHLLDRVRVIGNCMAMAMMEGYAMDIADTEDYAGMVTVEDVLGGRCNVPMASVERAFRAGDTVIVRRGKYKGRAGIVLAHSFTVLEVFDGMLICLMSISVVAHPDVPVQPHPLIQVPREQLRHSQQHNEAIYAVGRRYEGLHVLVVGAGIGVSSVQGAARLVIADYDSPQHVRRLSMKPAGQRHGQMRRETRGIMVTIKDMTNHQINVDIDFVVHEGTGLPLAQILHLLRELLTSFKLDIAVEPPPCPRTPDPPAGTNETVDWGLPGYESFRLPSESDSQWLCIATLVGKRVDVLVEGIKKMVRTKYHKPSPLLFGLDERHGFLLIDEPITPEALVKAKIMVYAVGANDRKHDAPGQFLKPVRDSPDGTPITGLRQYVVIIGGDMAGDTSALGSYAETRPDIAHSHGQHVVAVMLEGGAGPFFFHILRIGRAMNKEAENQKHKFPSTTFV